VNFRFVLASRPTAQLFARIEEGYVVLLILALLVSKAGLEINVKRRFVLELRQVLDPNVRICVEHV
jgi:hypothetical protein